MFRRKFLSEDVVYLALVMIVVLVVVMVVVVVKTFEYNERRHFLVQTSVTRRTDGMEPREDARQRTREDIIHPEGQSSLRDPTLVGSL